MGKILTFGIIFVFVLSILVLAQGTEDDGSHPIIVELVNMIFEEKIIDGPVWSIDQYVYDGPPLTVLNMRKELKKWVLGYHIEECINEMIVAKDGICESECAGDLDTCKRCVRLSGGNQHYCYTLGVILK